MHRVVAGILKSGRIASAYLFSGPASTEKEETVAQFLEQLGCREVDRIRIVPDGATVKIDQIRELQKLTRFGPTMSPRLVAVIEKADELLPEAAAAFLKTLEEPHEKVTFILLVEREDKLPATILSRCQRVRFGEAAVAWQKKPELNDWYAAVAAIGKKSLAEVLDLSSRLDKERERLEEILYELVYFVKEELNNLALVKILLETVKLIKRKASVKLALDVACLRMWETCRNNPS